MHECWSRGVSDLRGNSGPFGSILLPLASFLLVELAWRRNHIALQRQIHGVIRQSGPNGFVNLTPLLGSKLFWKEFGLDSDNCASRRTSNVSFDPRIAACTLAADCLAFARMLLGEQLKTHLFKCVSLVATVRLDAAEFDRPLNHRASIVACGLPYCEGGGTISTSGIVNWSLPSAGIVWGGRVRSRRSCA